MLINFLGIKECYSGILLDMDYMMLKPEERVKFHLALEVEDRIYFSLDFGLWPLYLWMSTNKKGKRN